MEIGVHEYASLGPLTFHVDTIISMAIVSSFLLISAAIIRFTVLRKPTKKTTLFGSFVELAYETLEGIPTGVMGHKGLAYVPLIATLFLFILFSNLFGLIPINAVYTVFFEKSLGHIPELTAPTANINTTAGLAIMVFSLMVLVGIKEHGIKYFKKYLEPNIIFLPLNLMEDLAKPLSLAIRLFGNTFGKETIIVVLVSLTVFPILYPLPILLLGVFIAVIQAFIFSLLTTFYIASAVSGGH